MQSIALFPCSYTDEARIIGELSNSLHLRVYTDEMLFSDISEQFGIPVEQLKRTLYEVTPEINRCNIAKNNFTDLARCSLEARKSASPDGFIFYGLHTSLLDAGNDRVMKVLVFDEMECRVQRAVLEEGFSEDTAKDFIMQHDEKVSGWTQFLFKEEPYAASLHDLVITCNNHKLLDITAEIIDIYHDFHRSPDPVQRSCSPSISEITL